MSFIANIFNSVVAFVQEKREEGQTLVEYALIIALISLVIIAAAGALSGAIASTFQTIADELTGATPS